MAKNLKEYRVEQGLTQFQLAQKANYTSPGNIASFENFKKNLTRDAAEKFASVLGVTTDELLTNHTLAEVMVVKQAFDGQMAQKSKNADATKEAMQFVEYLAEKASDVELPGSVRKSLAKAAKTILGEFE